MNYSGAVVTDSPRGDSNAGSYAFCRQPLDGLVVLTHVARGVSSIAGTGSTDRHETAKLPSGGDQEDFFGVWG